MPIQSREPTKSIQVMVMFILFSVIFLGTISAFEFDNVKNQDEETKIITIKNSLLGINWLSYGEVGSIELINYTGFCIPGNCYAYYKINHKVEDYSLKGSKYYDKSQTNLLVGKKAKYEIFNPSISYEVPIYEEVCIKEIGNKTNCKSVNTKTETRYGQ